jgi:long-chain acyl-CoA synthetase
MRADETSVRGYGAADLGWPLAHAASRHGDQLAVLDGTLRLTYAELARRVGALGGALEAVLEVEAGRRVGFLGVNSLAHLECWLAVPAFGRVLVDLNYRLTEEELAFMVEDCELEVLIADRDQLARASALKERCGSLRMLVLDGTLGAGEEYLLYEELVSGSPAPARDVDPAALAAISYTGGTTGTPKGVMLSHANLLANADHNLIATGHATSDRWLHACPMFHVAGTANAVACTWVGAQQVILPRFAPDAVLLAIERERVTHTVLVPTMLAMLLDQLEKTPADLTSLEHIQYAAAPIPPELQRRVLERLDCDIAQFYGMTEAAPTVSHMTPGDHRRGRAGEEPYRRRLRSVGAPVVGVQANVRDGDGRILEEGEVGEIWVRGANVMLGYWNRPEATEAALEGGWYHSGDAAYADADGYLYLVDRLKDMIITGGENVYSIEVEAALTEHPAVLEAAVFGIPDSRWGEAVHAVVTVSGDHSVEAEELRAHCRARIAGYKVPRTIHLQSEPLPKSGAGKLLKNILRAPYWEGQDRSI